MINPALPAGISFQSFIEAAALRAANLRAAARAARRRRRCTAALAGLLFGAWSAPDAHAHVGLEVQQAPADSYYKAVMRVPHGCSGSPTVKVRVQIAEGVTGVKAQPKAGWTLTTVKGRLATPLEDSHGNRISETVREVMWSGGRLLDENYDEFIMQVKLPDTPNTTIYFPVVQECEKGIHRWIEVPVGGKAPATLKEPAPALRLVPRPQ